VRYTVSQSVKTCATENTGFFACFAKRTFRHLSSNMAKHHRTTSIKATPPSIPHGDERPIGLCGTAFLRFQNRDQ
jgi:hypothetical protein